MTKNNSRVMRQAILLSGGLMLCLSGPVASAQEQAIAAAEAPLFEINPLFEDGVSRLVPSDGQEILLSRTGNQALVKFANDPEVRALRISPGAGNSELFKNDIGKLLLRLSDRGNLSLYTSDYPGEPLSVLGRMKAFPQPLAEDDDFSVRLSSYVSIRAHRDIAVEIDPASGQDMAWLQDAARIAAKSVLKLVDKVDDVKLIKIERAGYGDARYSEDGSLIISVAPSQGYFGRPSSDHIIAVIKNSFDS